MNLGIDIVENKRLMNKSEHFISLILTIKEQEEYKKRGLSYLCGRFAAKEAIMKCMSNTKKYSFTDIEVLTLPDGKPYCTNIPNLLISISHETNYTVAIAIALPN